MPNVLPARRNDDRVGLTSIRPVSRATGRALAQVEGQTYVRAALIRGEGYVQQEKMKEIDHLAREAMTGQAMLRKWGETLASGDLALASELLYFTDLARVGKSEVLADTIDTFCRESRS